MTKLKTLEAIVREVLTRYPKTRDDDRELALAVWTVGYGVSTWTPVSEVMRNKKLPSQESLGRVRRKIQETDTTLRGTRKKESVRMKAQADYMDYAEGRQ